MSIRKFISILFLGQPHSRPANKLKPAIKNQVINVLRIWRNKHHKDFGIERIIRLTLVCLQFIFPGLYIRHFFGRYGLLARKMGVEAYVFVKLMLPILFLLCNWTFSFWVVFLFSYLTMETIVYLSCLIFLSNEFAQPISYRRSLATLFMNYLEIGFNYAVIYSCCDNLILGFFKEKLHSDTQATYFSFVTTATVGYGDIVVSHWFGQLLVVSQIVLFFLFVGIFFNFFASRIQDATYYNAKPKYRGKEKK